ncbi:MAG: ABC transporter permease [Actinobacteria bacterium]|nr:ABC transporter permease [Actinomycetota bacterium]MCB9388631.1 ABC transporter permease [Acidimicrobiia bacterium]
MFRLALREIRGHKIRFALTTILVMFGVGFVVGSFVLTDSLRATFGQLSSDINANFDLAVRAEGDFGSRQEQTPIEASLLTNIRETPGVESADGVLVGYAQPTYVECDGEIAPAGTDQGAPGCQRKAVETQGPPIFGFSAGDHPELQALSLADGSWPGDGEFALDATTVEKYHYEIGQTYTVLVLSGPADFVLSGSINFAGETNDTVGAVFSVFDTATAQALFDYPDQFLSIYIKAEPGTDIGQLTEAVQWLLPEGVTVATSDDLTQESADGFNSIVGIFNNILLAFAFVTVLVASVLIFVVFTITIGQRMRELSLLRALGASAKQISRSVLGEAVAIGATATVLGVGLGVLIALGIRAALDAGGFGLPAGPVEIRPRTAIAALLVGIGITLIAAYSPARKSRRIPPIAALREDYAIPESSSRIRFAVGVIAGLFGLSCIAATMFNVVDGTAAMIVVLVLGALTLMLSVALLSDALARPLALGIGAPLPRLFRTPGEMARQNAARNPRRTSSTAAALMIGVAMIGMVTVVGQSLRSTFLSTLSSGISADFFIQANSPGTQFSPAAAESLESLDFVSASTGFRQGEISVEGETKTVTGARLSKIDALFDLGVVDGDPNQAGPGDILVHKDPARDLGLNVGDTVAVTTVAGGPQQFRVAAIFENASVVDNWVLDLGDWDANFNQKGDLFAAVAVSAGTDIGVADAQIRDALSEYPQLKIQTKEEFQDDNEAQLNAFLLTVNALLGFAVLVAMVGVAVTLSLSVFERTREIGLVRAVGMTRRQTRLMILLESLVISMFGALLGIFLGVTFGAAIAAIVPDTVINTVSVPVGQLVFLAALTALAGVLFALWPARRAARLKVLDAISSE